MRAWVTALKLVRAPPRIPSHATRPLRAMATTTSSGAAAAATPSPSSSPQPLFFSRAPSPEVHGSAVALAPASAVAPPPPGFAEWFAAVDTFLLDCDGVLWRGGVGIPGVSESVEAIRAAGKRVLFVTNNSTKTRAT
jgi:hypothetical protein